MKEGRRPIFARLCLELAPFVTIHISAVLHSKRTERRDICSKEGDVLKQ